MYSTESLIKEIMKQNCIKTVAISLLVTLSLSINASTRKANVARSVMVGNGIANLYLMALMPRKYLLLQLKRTSRTGSAFFRVGLVPDFSLTDGKAECIINHTGRYE